MATSDQISDKFFVNPTISVDGKTSKLDKLITPTTFDGSENDFYANHPNIEKPKYVGIISTGDDDQSKRIQKTFPGADVPSFARVMFDTDEQLLGYKDPREMQNCTYENPPGHIYLSKNISTGNIDIYPAEIKETMETVKKSPIGPKRSMENSNRRRNIGTMYGVPYEVMSSFLGHDSNGVPRYSEGNSYIEKCIFMGYDRSFIEPSSVLNVMMKESAPDWAPNALAGIVLNQKVFKDDTIWISKSGLYYTRSLPVDSIFLGYNDGNVIPTKNPLTWASSKEINIGGNATKPYKVRSFYSDKIGSFELRNHKILNVEGSPVADIINDKNSIKSFSINESLYWSDKEVNRIKALNIFDQNSLNNCTAKSYIRNSRDTNEGSYRRLLNSLNKADLLEYVHEMGDVSVSPIQAERKSSKVDMIYPRLKRRSEQYGPNPMQHLFYMDFYDWRKYETNYMLKVPSGPFFDLTGVADSLAQSNGLKTIYDRAGDSFQLPNDRLLGLTNVYVYSNGRISNGLSRHPNLSDSAVLLSDRFTRPNPEFPNVYLDNTYILDVYFGLMELHLKSFSWGTIFAIIDMIPQFYGEYLDNSIVDWKSKSQTEKSRIRLKQLDESLKPVWDIISKLLYEYELQNSRG